MKKLMIIILVLAMTFGLFACAGNSDETESTTQGTETTADSNETTAAKNEEPFKVGIFLRFSDEAGSKMKAVITEAFRRINENGGIAGTEVETIFYDTEGDPAKAIDAFTRLAAEDKVLLAIGPTTSSCALAVIDLAKEYEIPMITPQSTNTSITVDYGNEWFFRNSVADIYHSYTLCDYVVNDMKSEKIAIVHETGTLGLGQYENFVSRLESEYGMEPIIVQEWNEGDVDFKTQMLAVKAAEPDVIIFAGHEAELAIAVSQRLEVGISEDIPVCGFSSMSSSDYYGVAGEAAVGSIFTTTFSPTDTREDIQTFVKEYSSVITGGMDHNSAQAYDTVMLVSDVMSQISITNTEDSLAADRTAIRDGLAQVKDWVGLTGVTSFGVTGSAEDRDGKKVCTVYQLEPDYTWSSLKAAQ
jgi:branched-chain amino acid transport system substrate-binding protein